MTKLRDEDREFVKGSLAGDVEDLNHALRELGRGIGDALEPAVQLWIRFLRHFKLL